MQARNEVRGPLYTSIVGLAVVVALLMGAALAAMRWWGNPSQHGSGVEPVGDDDCAGNGQFCCGEAESDGTSERLPSLDFGREIWIPWLNVRQIEGGRFGCKVRLRPATVDRPQTNEQVHLRTVGPTAAGTGVPFGQYSPGRCVESRGPSCPMSKPGCGADPRVLGGPTIPVVRGRSPTPTREVLSIWPAQCSERRSACGPR